jgi:hypothetical protein
LIHHGGVSAKVLAVPGKTHVTLDADMGTPAIPPRHRPPIRRCTTEVADFDRRAVRE